MKERKSLNHRLLESISAGPLGPLSDETELKKLKDYAINLHRFDSLDQCFGRKKDNNYFIKNAGYNPSRCIYCNRPLTKQSSIEKGHGHKCEHKSAERLKEYIERFSTEEIKDKYPIEKKIENIIEYLNSITVRVLESNFQQKLKNVVFNKTMELFKANEDSDLLINANDKPLILKNLEKELLKIYNKEKDKTKFKYVIMKKEEE